MTHNCLRFYLAIICAIAPTMVSAQAPPEDGPNCLDKPTNASYVFSASMILGERPSPEAMTVPAKIAAADVAMVLCYTGGWLRVLLIDGASKEVKGWIATTGTPRENFVAASWVNVRLAKVRSADKPWSAATKLDILRRIARVGFTSEQVMLALGDPLRRVSNETAAGVTEEWFYQLQKITFANGKVSAITRIS